MSYGRGPFGGLFRFLDRRGPPAPPRRGLFDDYSGRSRFGASFGYGRDRTFRMVLLAIVILLVGIFVGRHWNEIFQHPLF